MFLNLLQLDVGRRAAIAADTAADAVAMARTDAAVVADAVDKSFLINTSSSFLKSYVIKKKIIKNFNMYNYYFNMFNNDKY